MALRRQDLYDDDFYVWARRQAAELKKLAATRPNIDVDWPNLIDEVSHLATEYRDACRSQLRRLMEHMLKLEYSPAIRPRGLWAREVADARATLTSKLTRTLKADLRRNMPQIYELARTIAAAGMEGYGEQEAAANLPAECPYTLEQLLEKGVYPKSKAGAT